MTSSSSETVGNYTQNMCENIKDNKEMKKSWPLATCIWEYTFITSLEWIRDKWIKWF